MKQCPACEREFLDMYETCPFCAKRTENTEPLASGQYTPVPDVTVRKAAPRKGLLALLVGGGGGLFLLGFWLVWGAYNAAVVVPTTMNAADSATCFANQVEYERAAMVYFAEKDEQPTSLEQLDEYVPTSKGCRSGGVYSITFNLEMPKISCSVHGSKQDQP